MLKNRFGAFVGATALAAGLVFAGSQLASAAPENPALDGNRVLCVDTFGNQKVLPAPCAQHKDAVDKPMWFAGPVPVPGAAGYADSVKAIVGSGGGVGPTGPAGPQGPKGDPGVCPDGYAVKDVTVANAAKTKADAEALKKAQADLTDAKAVLVAKEKAVEAADAAITAAQAAVDSAPSVAAKLIAQAKMADAVVAKTAAVNAVGVAEKDVDRKSVV
mgnify:FL=1